MQHSSVLARLALLTLLLAPGLGMRVIDSGTAGEGQQACTAKTCKTFRKEDACSCAPFVGSPELAGRVKALLRDTIQMVRRVSDKLSPESGMFAKLWYGGAVGHAQRDLKFLEGAVPAMPEIQRLVDTAVKKIAPAEFALPAGAMPVMVEVWDKGRVRRDTFIGEAGLPLAMSGVAGEAEPERTLPLTANGRHGSSSILPEGATVTVRYHVERSAPYTCGDPAAAIPLRWCVHISVWVECVRAGGLPSFGGGTPTDAFCKVRIKKDASVKSTIFQTPVTSNSLDPIFDEAKRKFDLAWEEVLIEPHVTAMTPGEWEVLPGPESCAPWTLDEMTISEQLSAMMYYLASEVFVNTKRCKHKAFKTICKFVDKLGAIGVNKTALEELAEETQDPSLKAFAAQLEGLDSLSEQSSAEESTAAWAESLAQLGGGRSGWTMASVQDRQREERRRFELAHFGVDFENLDEHTKWGASDGQEGVAVAAILFTLVVATIVICIVLMV